MVLAIKLVVARDYKNHPAQDLLIQFACVHGFYWTLASENTINKAISTKKGEYAEHKRNAAWEYYYPNAGLRRALTISAIAMVFIAKYRLEKLITVPIITAARAIYATPVVPVVATIAMFGFKNEIGHVVKYAKHSLSGWVQTWPDFNCELAWLNAPMANPKSIPSAIVADDAAKPLSAVPTALAADGEESDLGDEETEGEALKRHVVYDMSTNIACDIISRGCERDIFVPEECESVANSDVSFNTVSVRTGDMSEYDMGPTGRNTVAVPPTRQALPMVTFTHIKITSLSYTRKVFDMITQYMGTTELCDMVGTNQTSYIKPDFIGKHREVVHYTKIQSRKPIVLDKTGKTSIKERPGACHQTTYVSHIGPCFLGIIPSAFDNSIENEYSALAGRHVKVPTSEKELWAQATEVLIRKLGWAANLAETYTLDDWLLIQPPAKRDKYDKFRYQLMDMSFAQARSHKRNFFIKDELIVPSLGSNNRDKYPRGIQGLCEATSNMALGPFMTVVSKAVARAAKQDGNYTRFFYTSGSTPEQVGEWYHVMKSNGYKFYENDFSAYDSTQGKGAHDCEVEFYKLFHPQEYVLGALEKQKCTNGVAKNHTYSCPYTRKSGDQNTSIGNTLINFAAHALVLENMGIVDYYMLGLGDDNLLAIRGSVPDEFESKVTQFIRKLGLEPKFKASKFPTYCSSRFVPVASGHVLVPDLFRRLCKLGWCHRDLPKNVTPIARLKGNELANPNNTLMPISRVFYHFYANAGGESAEEERWRPHATSTLNTQMTEETYQWFHTYYGLTKTEIDEVESFIAVHLTAAAGQPSAYSHPLLIKAYHHQDGY
jgi:hypothetical protein